MCLYFINGYYDVLFEYYNIQTQITVKRVTIKRWIFCTCTYVMYVFHFKLTRRVHTSYVNARLYFCIFIVFLFFWFTHITSRHNSSHPSEDHYESRLEMMSLCLTRYLEETAIGHNPAESYTRVFRRSCFRVVTIMLMHFYPQDRCAVVQCTYLVPL